MAKWIHASPDRAVETLSEGGPPHRRALVPGVMRALVQVYEPGDECPPHPSLPTIAELLSMRVDPASGLLVFDARGVTLTMDPAPLRELPQGLRVSIGWSFVPRELLERARRGSPSSSSGSSS